MSVQQFLTDYPFFILDHLGSIHCPSINPLDKQVLLTVISVKESGPKAIVPIGSNSEQHEPHQQHRPSVHRLFFCGDRISQAGEGHTGEELLQLASEDLNVLTMARHCRAYKLPVSSSRNSTFANCCMYDEDRSMCGHVLQYKCLSCTSAIHNK